jgi:hypothetical protein
MRPLTRAELVKTYLVSRPGMPHCIRCIVAAIHGSPAVVRNACMRVRGSHGIRDSEGACTVCGRRRLVLMASHGLTDGRAPRASGWPAERLEDVLAAMTDTQVAFITGLILERPLCVSCIANKADMVSADPLATMLERIRHIYTLSKDHGRCQSCGLTTTLMSVARHE